jgi:hypothetical protein
MGKQAKKKPTVSKKATVKKEVKKEEPKQESKIKDIEKELEEQKAASLVAEPQAPRKPQLNKEGMKEYVAKIKALEEEMAKDTKEWGKAGFNIRRMHAVTTLLRRAGNVLGRAC